MIYKLFSSWGQKNPIMSKLTGINLVGTFGPHNVMGIPGTHTLNSQQNFKNSLIIYLDPLTKQMINYKTSQVI